MLCVRDSGRRNSTGRVLVKCVSAWNTWRKKRWAQALLIPRICVPYELHAGLSTECNQCCLYFSHLFSTSLTVTGTRAQIHMIIYIFLNVDIIRIKLGISCTDSYMHRQSELFWLSIRTMHWISISFCCHVWSNPLSVSSTTEWPF